MKKILTAFFLLSSLSAQAGVYDHQTLICKNGDLELILAGKKHIFGGRNIAIKKAGKILIDESYNEEEYIYSDKMGSTTPQMFDAIINLAYKLRPQSIHHDMDHHFVVSDSAIMMQTHDNLSRAYGGESSLILVQLDQYNELLRFDVESQCKSVEQL